MPALVPVAAMLSVAWLLAVIMNVAVLHQLLLVMTVTAWAFATFGLPARVPILAGALTFLLAVPFWGFANPVLRRATTLMSGGIAKLGGATAIIEDDTITIASGTFLVESGCAGINFLMAGLTLGAFYAHLFTDRWQTQLKIVAAAGGAAIVGNWIRVAVLVLLGEATNMESPMIYDHLWQGWAIFTLLMIPTYFLVRWIERRDAPKAAAERAATEQAATFDPARPRRAATAGAFALVGPLLYMGLGVVPKIGAPDRSPDVLDLAPRWTAVERAPGEGAWTPHYVGIDERVDWTIALAGATVDAGRYYFVDQRQGEEMIMWENAMAADSASVSDRLVGPVGSRRRYVREAIFWDGAQPRIAWYWYRVAGIDTPFSSRAKLLEIFAFALRSPASELITLSAKCAADNCVDAARALRTAVEGAAGD
jgi:exosortase